MKNFQKNQQEMHTLNNQSMPQSAENDTCFCQNSKKSSKNISFLRKPRLFKVLAAGGLAIMMGVSVLCGVLIAPMNSAQANTLAGETSQTLSAEEKLVIGQGLGLDPENDPVIYTTESGLQIKYSNGGLPTGSVATTPLKGYAYVTMAGYNWVIIGQSTTKSANYSLHTYHKGWATSSYVDRNTVAGNAVFNDNNLGNYGIVNGGISGTVINFPNAVSTGEIPAGCVLVFSEKNIGANTIFNDDYDPAVGNFNDYTLSTCELQIAVNNVVKKFSDFEKKFISTTTLKTAYYDHNRNVNKSKLNSSFSAQLFPLATAYTWREYQGTNLSTDSNYTSQNFKIETYLGGISNSNTNTNAKVLSYLEGTTDITNYWLRTGRAPQYSSDSVQAAYINRDRFGETNVGSGGQSGVNGIGVRPAFVLKLI